MKRIGNSNEPTPRQMMNMANNLHEKYGKYCSVELVANAFSSGTEMWYRIYIEGIGFTKEVHDWPTCLADYFKLVRG